MISGLQPVEKTTACGSVVQQLVRGITAGIWTPGQKLPSERDMVKALGVGRTSVREALRACEALGLIDVRQGEGSFVKASPGIVVPESILASFVRDSSQLLKLFEVRELLEPYMTALAAQRRDDEHIERLEEILGEMAQQQDASTIIELDLEFHLVVAEAAENDLLFEFERVILEAMQASWLLALELSGRPQLNLEESRDILEAIKVRDAERAETVARRHLLAGKDSILERYRQRLVSTSSASEIRHEAHTLAS